MTSIAGTVYGVVNPTFTYDNNGNMTSGAGRTMTWTSFNLAATVSQGTATAAFAYDPEHKRITQTGTVVGGEVRYLNDPMSGATSERFVPTSGQSVWRDYILAEGRVIALRTYNATSGAVTLRYFVGDHLGSTAVIVGAARARSVARGGRSRTSIVDSRRRDRAQPRRLSPGEP